MKIEEKLKMFVERFDSKDFIFNKFKRKDEVIITPQITIKYNKLNKLSIDEVNIALDKDISLHIDLDEKSIDNLIIDKNRELLKKANYILIHVSYDYLLKNKNKIKEINKCNKLMTFDIVDDYKLYSKDSNILNDFELDGRIILPFQYAMWLDLDKIDIRNKIKFRHDSGDYYTVNEMKEIKKKVLEIIENIYSDYSNLNEYEKFYLAFKYAQDNWHFDENTYKDDNGNYIIDKHGHRWNDSLFNILDTGISVCSGMSGLFTMILNNPIVRVNANRVSGHWNSIGHAWINTVIDNKVYENCLTLECTLDKPAGRIFTKLNSSYKYGDNKYLDNYKFLINRKLGLPLEYSEIPNAREKLSESVKYKRIVKDNSEQTTKNSDTMTNSKTNNYSDFIPKYNWENYSYIIDEISKLPCNNEDKILIEEYIYRAIKLKFITQSNIDNVINNIKDYYNGININAKAIPVNKRTNPNEVITKILLKSNADIIIEDYKNNISRVIPGEIEQGWKKIDELLIEMITYLINNYPNSLNYSLDKYIGKKADTLYSFGKPLKDCGCKEDISKDKIIRDLIRKRFDSGYEKKIIDEFSVINPSYPNMHKDFYEILKSICKIFENENDILVTAYKIKLETITNEYRDYRGIPDSDIDYIDLSGRIIKK